MPNHKSKKAARKLQRTLKKRARRRRIACLAAAGLLGVAPDFVLAQGSPLPTGGQVVAGQAAIQAAGTTMNVQAATQRAIVNWDSFGVGAANTANFQLPDANSAILNRVVTPNMPSAIHGALNSNGHVYLVNPSGIVVGANGVVNTNGFVASTFDVANDKFMAGGALEFKNNGSSAAIVNQGTINTGAGGAHLIANELRNSGTITSEGGNITLSGGGTVTLNNGVTYVQPSLQTLESGISPTAGLIQNTGTIRATGAATSGGEVYLVNPNGNILHDGTIAAQRHTETDTTHGGHVQLEADQIQLTEASAIDATGTHGGGDVLVGGDWQGSGDMAQATTVTMEAGAKIDASATGQGDGGKIVLWSDIHNFESVTKAFGSLIARAGELFGDGGQIETSGQQIVTDGISVDAGAENGTGGHWLIDPYNYVIDAIAANNIASTLDTGTSVTVATTANNASFGSSGDNGELGDITVSSAITKASGGDATLTLNAANSIIVDAAVSSSAGELNVTLDADNNSGVGDGGGIVILGNDITTNGGDLRFGTDRTATIGGFSTKVGGDVYAAAGTTLSTGGGDVEVSGETILAATGGLTINTVGGDVTFDGVLNSGNTYSFVVGAPGTGSWESAVADAKNGTSGGAATGDSYLVAIASRLENSIANSVTIDNGAYRGAWIGAYRDRNNTQGNGTSIWHYAGGPDADQPFYSQDGNNSNDSYNNFGSGEPNGTGTGGEYAGQFFGNQALWNDLPGSVTYSANMTSEYNVMGYVRETNLAASPLTINAGAGAVTFNAGIGASKAISTMNVTAGSVTLNGNSLVTTGAQNYSSALTVNSSSGLNVDGTTLTTGGALDFTAADDITIDAAISVPGSINIQGDEIAINENLTSTDTGDIYIQSNSATTGSIVATGDIAKTGGDRSTLTLRGDGRVTSNVISASGGAVLDTVLWSDYHDDNQGGTSIFGDINTNGGHLWAGGSASDGGSTTWNGLTVGDGASVGASGANHNAFDLYANISTGDGDVALVAGLGFSAGTDGIGLGANHSINSGTGDITLIADDVDGAVLTVDTTGHFTFAPNSNAWSSALLSGTQLDFDGTIGSDTFTGTTDVDWLKINNYSTLGGLTLGKDGNASNIYIRTPIDIAGPINLFGATVTLDANLNSTATTGTGILLSGSKIVQNAGVDVTTSGADIAYVANGLTPTNVFDYAIQLADSSGVQVGIDANGGDISLNASYGLGGAAGGGDRAIWLRDSVVETSGTGTITIVGDATNTPTTSLGWGMQFEDSVIQTESGAINITGIGGKGSTNSRGIAVGDALSIVSESGAITIRDLRPSGLTGTYQGILLQPGNSSDLYFGADGSTVASSTSDITVESDQVTLLPENGFGTTFNTSGDVVIESTANSFSSAVDLSELSIIGMPSSLRVGKSGNTADIIVGGNQSVAGAINVYGGNININADINTTAGGVAGDVLLKAATNITQAANADITTDGGDVTFWADSSDNSNGYILLGDAASVVTSGGNIVMGGGADSGGDGVPDGDAIGQAQLTASGGPFYSGVSLNNATLDTQNGGSLDATAGNITIKGTSTYTGGDRAVGVMLFGAKLTGDVIDVTGSVTDTGGTTTRYGISANGGTTPNNTNIAAFGGITLTGNAATPADQYSIRYGTNHEMSVIDGDITINSNGQLQYLSSQTLSLADTRSLIFNSDYDAEWRNVIAGQGGLIKQGTGELRLTSSNTYTGATTISGGTLNIEHNAPTIATSGFAGPGHLIVQSANADFSGTFDASSWNFGSTLGSLTVGKVGNTSGVTMPQTTVAGPVSIHGGVLDLQGITSTGTQTYVGASFENDSVLNAGTADISIETDLIALGGNLQSTGDLTITTSTNGQTIGVGTGTGTFSINTSELLFLQDGFNSITIGGGSAGDLNVGGLVSLPQHMELKAGNSSDLFVTDAISWSSDDTLTLSAGQDIFVNSDIDITGAAAGLNLYYGGTDGTSAPGGSYDYYIDVANRREINFAETTAGLKIGNEAFTLIDSVSDLQGMSASGRYALAGDVDLSGTTYTDAFYSTTFTGKLDGLGHEANGLTVRANAGGNFGLFGQLSGASVRHLGVTDIDILGQSTSNAAANDLRIGGIVGNVSGSGTTVLDGVWSTGVIATKQGSQQDVFYAGGIAGGHDSGTLQILRSFSTANVSSQGSHSGKMALGGLLGDSGDNNGISGIGGSAQHVVIDRSYATGSIVEGTYDGYYGSGGLVGVIYGNSATLTDSFSRSNVVGGISSGGIAGFSSPGTTKTYQRLYTTLDRFGNGTTPSDSYHSGTLDTATNNGMQLPSGWSSEIWAAGEFPTLKAVGVPASLLYVQVTGGTGVYGDLAAPTYQIVDADGNVVTFGSGDYVGLDGISGTGRYTLGQFTSAGNYNNVSYLSGLGFTGDDANLFALNPFTTAGSFTIQPRSITAVLANTGVDKVYDGNVNAGPGFTPTWSFTNIVSGDSATLNTGSLFFNAASVADANLFTINGLSLAGITGSNGSVVSDYALSSTSASVAANITVKPIVVSGLFANDKIYDGNTTASINTDSVSFSGAVSGDTLSLDTLTGVFADRNVGSNKVVSVTGTLSGTDAANYSTSIPATLQADITPRTITVSGISANDKAYDATTNATLSGTATANTLAGDSVSLETNYIANFTSENAANGVNVVVTGYVLSGPDSANYSLDQPSALTADITPAPLEITVNDDSKFVTTADLAGYAGATFSGFVGSEGIGDLSGSLSIIRNGADEASGTYDGVLSASGLTSTNYAITYASGDYTIIPAEQFLVRFGNSATTYGDSLGFNFLSADYMDAGNSVSSLTPVVSGNEYTFTDGVGGVASFTLGLDGATLSSSGNANVGTYGLTMNDLSAVGGNFSDNLNLIGSHTINRASLTIGAGGVSKTYDGTVEMNNLSLNITGLVAGDAVTINGQGNYTSVNADTGLSYLVENLAITGSDANNYVLPGGTTLSGTNGVISPKDITIAAPSVSKVYDGNTSIAATVDQLLNWSTQLGVSGDTVDAITLTYDDKNVGTEKSLTPSGIAISDGNGGANYNVIYADNNTSAITRLATVHWTGGATGDWNDPTNWAGGAVPDLGNVANVVIPEGVTPTLDDTATGPIELDSFVGGSLTMNGGTMNVEETFSGETFTQAGGTLSAGSLELDDYDQNDGAVVVDDDFTVNDSFQQGSDGTTDVGGTVNITHTTGTLDIQNLTGGDVYLHSTDGGVDIHELNVNGDLEIHADDDIHQTMTGQVSVEGTTVFSTPGVASLPNPNNYFGDYVSLDVESFDVQASLPILFTPVGVNAATAFQAALADTARDSFERDAREIESAQTRTVLSQMVRWYEQFRQFVASVNPRNLIRGVNPQPKLEVFSDEDDIIVGHPNAVTNK